MWEGEGSLRPHEHQMVSASTYYSSTKEGVWVKLDYMAQPVYGDPLLPNFGQQLKAYFGTQSCKPQVDYYLMLADFYGYSGLYVSGLVSFGIF